MTEETCPSIDFATHYLTETRLLKGTKNESLPFCSLKCGYISPSPPISWLFIMEISQLYKMIACNKCPWVQNQRLLLLWAGREWGGRGERQSYHIEASPKAALHKRLNAQRWGLCAIPLEASVPSETAGRPKALQCTAMTPPSLRYSINSTNSNSHLHKWTNYHGKGESVRYAPHASLWEPWASLPLQKLILESFFPLHITTVWKLFSPLRRSHASPFPSGV